MIDTTITTTPRCRYATLRRRCHYRHASCRRHYYADDPLIFHDIDDDDADDWLDWFDWLSDISRLLINYHYHHFHAILFFPCLWISLPASPALAPACLLPALPYFLFHFQPACCLSAACISSWITWILYFHHHYFSLLDWEVGFSSSISPSSSIPFAAITPPFTARHYRLTRSACALSPCRARYAFWYAPCRRRATPRRHAVTMMPLPMILQRRTPRQRASRCWFT